MTPPLDNILAIMGIVIKEYIKDGRTHINLLLPAVEVIVISSVKVVEELKHYTPYIAPIENIVEHGESKELLGKPTINHECLIKCENNCGEFEEQLTEAKKEGQELTDEGKEYYEELKKLVHGKSSSVSSTPSSSGVPPSSPFPATSSTSPLKTAETKKKQLKAEIANLEATNNKTPTQETQLTNKKQELKGVEELETVIKYFLENSIKKINIEGEKLVIEYSNGTKKTVAIDNNQLKTVRDRMKKVNKKSLLASELGLDYGAKNNPSSNNSSNQTNTDKKW
ncbi:12303_t:CDS:2 [Ambispora gerdemannii]|uniref:12303_t:CDS:1 n=1 Tax=Ambispora gerdemannii TaxID=144530 RepID=A0A9N9DNX2_9GLOM|nr:12303_t:CDS:2 [Ambispora gerdemannii]